MENDKLDAAIARLEEMGMGDPHAAAMAAGLAATEAAPARTPKQFFEELVDWPECGGFQHDRLAEILSEFEGRIARLEARR